MRSSCYLEYQNCVYMDFFLQNMKQDVVEVQDSLIIVQIHIVTHNASNDTITIYTYSEKRNGM